MHIDKLPASLIFIAFCLARSPMELRTAPKTAIWAIYPPGPFWQRARKTARPVPGMRVQRFGPPSPCRPSSLADSLTSCVYCADSSRAVSYIFQRQGSLECFLTHSMNSPRVELHLVHDGTRLMVALFCLFPSRWSGTSEFRYAAPFIHLISTPHQWHLCDPGPIESYRTFLCSYS